jgi:hypothetical protein
MDEDRDDPLDQADPGTTSILTPEGWEAASFVAPEPDWQLEDDGSYTAPDGRTRTWLLTGPEAGWTPPTEG